MRLLKIDANGKLRLTAPIQENIPPYAILSHTWGQDRDEVELDDIKYGRYEGKLGYAKVRFCAEQARRDQLEYFWVDTCCINKANHTELSESITSMFRWYRDAAKCYVYLSDVSVSAGDEGHSRRTWKLDFRNSRWFTRGWTLQELLAPSMVEFFSSEGEKLGGKDTLEGQIAEITGIPIAALRGAPLTQFSDEERLRWAEQRKTKKKEDRAYCLLGIFDVYMPLMYGEGDNAFTRLEREVEQSPRRSRGFEASASEVLDTATRGFRTCLPPQIAEKFQLHSTSQNMLEHLRGYCKSRSSGLTTSDLCDRFLKIATSLEPLCEIISSIVASPTVECAKFARGAMHMVFVLGSRHEPLLEKIAASLEKVVKKLPTYSLPWANARRIHPPDRRHVVPSDRSRIAVLLAFVFSDIIQLCQSFCAMLATDREGTYKQHGPIRELFWSPFDMRFNNILDRLREHRHLFRAEIDLEEQKAQVNQYQNMRTDSEAKNIQCTVAKLRMQIQQAEMEISKRFNDFMHSITKPESHTKLSHKGIEDKEELLRKNKIFSLQNWINSPEYVKEFERARFLRYPDTASWITSIKEYTKWRDLDTTDRTKTSLHCGWPCSIPFHNRVLSLQAKPGYGKTVLSSFIVEDLQLMAPDSTRMECTIAFFHFTAGQFNATDPTQAFRAITVQLLHANQENRDLIDALCLLTGDVGSERLLASDGEVEQIFRLLVQLLPTCYFVLDGVDECTRPAEFLRRFSDQCGDSHSKAVVLHRPNLQLPGPWDRCEKALLNRTLNIADIKTFVSADLGQLPEPSKFTAGIPEIEFVESVTLRANGMFLWAKLLMEYLKCPALTQSERLECVTEANMVEGIENLYMKILQQVQSKYRKEKDLVFKMLRMVAIALRPLSLKEMEYALAIRPGYVTSAANRITDLDSSWVFLCGSLLEKREDSTMGFIHVSFAEFLESLETITMDCHVDRGPCHANMSNICLSYLLFDMPVSMLSWRPDQRTSLGILRHSFPFLDYAMSWVKHGESYVEKDGSAPGRMAGVDLYRTLVSSIGDLLSRHLSATVWIEACWTFGTQPQLRTLWKGLCGMASTYVIPPFGAMTTLERLGQFVVDLEILAKEWSHVLSIYPGEIWGESITAFSQSRFWYQTVETEVTRFNINKFPSTAGLTETVENSQIVIASQVSRDEKYLGLISLCPSEKYMTFVRLHAARTAKFKRGDAVFSTPVSSTTTNGLSEGWTARYKVWRLQGKCALFDVEISLPPGQIRNILDISLASQCPWRFPFPAAFSPDLDRVLILETVSQISVAHNGSAGFCRTQVLPIGQRASSTTDNLHSYSTLEPFFSPDGLCIAVIESPGNPDAGRAPTIKPRRLSVWRQFTSGSTHPDYVYIGQHLVSNAVSRRARRFQNSLAFHPHLPFVAFPQWDRTSLWYLRHGASPDLLVKSSLQNLRFTSDKEISGVWMVYNNRRENLGDGHDGDDDNNPTEEAVKLYVWNTIEKHLDQHEITDYEQRMTKETAALKRGLLIEHIHQSTLTKYEYLSDQVSLAQRRGSCQTFLPSGRASSATYLTSLRGTDTAEQMVWNKDFQESYSVLDQPEQHFPSIIERRTGNWNLSKGHPDRAKLSLPGPELDRPMSLANVVHNMVPTQHHTPMVREKHQ